MAEQCKFVASEFDVMAEQCEKVFIYLFICFFIHLFIYLLVYSPVY